MMQWETKASFSGQVKPVGMENMSWKTGSVHFDQDENSGSWLAKLFFKVNPSKAFYEMKIGLSDTLDVKCHRLMIENSKGNGIHIKLLAKDLNDAKQLVSKIKKMLSSKPTVNKAEVGMSTTNQAKKLKDVSPSALSDAASHTDLFGLSDDNSLEHSLNGSLLKKTPPLKSKDHNSTPKRKLLIFSNEIDDEMEISEEDLKEPSTSPSHFTGVKDYSKRNLQGGNGLPETVVNKLGAKSFYGSHSSVSDGNFGKNYQTPNNKGGDRSPSLKRQKFSPSLSIQSGDTSSDPKSSTPLRSKESSIGQSPQVSRRPARVDIIGFQNLGNTCFLNSPLQCLSTLEPLSLDIQSSVEQFGAELNPNSLIRKLYTLMKDVRKLDVCPDRVKEILVRLRTDMNVKFAPNTQQDAHELLSELLDRVDEEVKAAHKLQATPTSATDHSNQLAPGGEEAAALSVESAPLMCTPSEANFCWFYRTCMYFHECRSEVVSAQTEKEMTLMLALDSSTKTLQDCVNKYFESTEVEMKCDKCGKDEKATITRKIIRRPRIFILNLMRYQSSNTGATKKADRVLVPSYISICQYCADDVKQPPDIDPIFLLDRIKKNQIVKSGKAATPAKTPSHEADDEEALLEPDIGQCDLSSETLNNYGLPSNSATFTDPRTCISLIVDFICLVLRSMDKLVEAAPEGDNKIVHLMEHSKNLITDYKERIASRRVNHNRASQDAEVAMPVSPSRKVLFEQLLRRLLNLQEEKYLDSNLVSQVLGELLTIRYDQIRRGRNQKLLNKDLALCIAAVEKSVLELESLNSNVSTMEEIVDSYHVARNKNQSAVRGGRNLDGNVPNFDMMNGSDSEDDAVSFKKAVNQVIPESDADDEEDEEAARDEDEGSVRKVSIAVQSSESVPENMWKDDDLWPEESADEFRDVPGGDGASRTSYLYNDEVSVQLLQGKDISLYTESDLQNVDCAALTDDEMMVYAQALSRFEYVKEQEAQVRSALEADMGLSAPGSPPDLSCGISEAGWGLTELKSPSGKMLSSSGESNILSVTEMETQPIVSLGHFQQTDDHSNDVVAVEKHSSSAESGCLQDMEGDKLSGESDLLCQEDLNDMDEPDGGGQPGFALGDPTATSANCSVCGKFPCSGGHKVVGGATSRAAVSSHLEETRSEILSSSASKGNSSPLCNQGLASHSQRDHTAESHNQKSHEQNVSVSGARCSLSSKKEYLYSPSKTNNFVKSKDYVRLKSPIVSPRKRISRGQTPKSGGSVSKCLSFNSGDRVESIAKLTHEESFDTGAVSSRKLNDSSMDVNFDSMSFLEDISDCSFADPPSANVSLQSTPRHLTNSTPTGVSACRARNSSQLSPVSSRRAGTSSLSSATGDASNYCPLLSPGHKLSEVRVDQLEISSPPARQVSDSLDHGAHVDKSGDNFSVADVTDLDEKENVHRNQSRINLLHNYELGKADLSYKLVGVVDHTGTTQFTGHYTAYTFNLRKQRWFHLNDSETYMVTEEEVREKNTQTGYLFFYMDKDLFDGYQEKVNSGTPGKTQSSLFQPSPAASVQ